MLLYQSLPLQNRDLSQIFKRSQDSQRVPRSSGTQQLYLSPQDPDRWRIERVISVDKQRIAAMGMIGKFFGLIFGIFGVLFGGLWDTVVGAFQGSETTEEPAAEVTSVSASNTNAAMAAAAPPTPAPTPTPAPAPAPAMSAPQGSSTQSAPPPFDPDQMMIPQPRRRPGKSLEMFKEMARDLPSARR